MTRLRDLRPQRASGAMDWVFITLALAVLLLLVGVSMFVWMFSQREYWKADPTMPSVFVMFSKVINGSTIGVLCVFIAVVIATAAVLLGFFRSKHEQVLANQAQIIGMLSSGRFTVRPSIGALPRSDTGAYRVLIQRTAHAEEALAEIKETLESMPTSRGKSVVQGFTEYLTAIDDLRHNGDDGASSVA